MMRKIGLKRPNKLSLGPKKVSPPIIPGGGGGDLGGQRVSGVYSEAGEGGRHGAEFNISFDSVQSDSAAVYGMRDMQGGVQHMQEYMRDDCSDSSYGQASGSSSGYSSNVTSEREDSARMRGQVSNSSFKEPLCPPPPGHHVVMRHAPPSTPGSSVGSPVEAGPYRTSMSSLDSGWASHNTNRGGLSSFTSHASASSLNSDRTGASGMSGIAEDQLEDIRPMVTFPQRRLSTLSSGQAPAPVPQRSSSIRASFRGSSESVSSISRCSGSDIYRPASNSSGGHQRRYSSSSSISSSRNGDDAICSLDVRQMIAQGLPDLEIVNCWLTDLRFEEYFSLFASAGYDMPSIARMTPEDLTAIGIKKPHHRKKIKTEIDKLCLQDWLPQQIPQTVEHLMHILNLAMYTNNLEEQGYTTVKDILSISIEDLEDIGFFMLGHQKRLLLGIRRVKELRSGRRPSVMTQEYTPEEVTMASLPPTLSSSKQSFSSFHALPGKGQVSTNGLLFPQHPELGPSGHHSSEINPGHHPELGQTNINSYSDMPTPMQPLNHNFYQTFSRLESPSSQQNAGFGIHGTAQHQPGPKQIPKSSSSIWQKFPSFQDQVDQQNSVTTSVTIHDHPNKSSYSTTGTLTRHRDQDLQIFSCHEVSSSGTLPRPTATVKPLTQTRDCVTSGDVPVVCDDVCSDHNMPFANERLGTIRLKTNPQEAFAEYERQEDIGDHNHHDDSFPPPPPDAHSTPGSSSSCKNLLRTPTRAPNRSATAVMDDISSMLADLTTELDSMLCSDSVQ